MIKGGSESTMLRAKVQTIEVLVRNWGIMIHNIGRDTVFCNITTSHMAQLELSFAGHHIFVEARRAQIGYTWHSSLLFELLFDRWQSCHLVGLVHLKID